MDWSEAERRAAQRPGDQAESEGSRAVKPAQRERDKKRERKRPGDVPNASVTRTETEKIIKEESP